MSDTPSLTYTCPCGTVHSAGPWGASHWDETLVHRCAACGRENTIRSGTVLRSRQRRAAAAVSHGTSGAHTRKE